MLTVCGIINIPKITGQEKLVSDDNSYYVLNVQPLVHNNERCGAKYIVKYHTHTHTHTCSYIPVYICILKILRIF